MASAIAFPHIDLPPAALQLHQEVRAFLRQQKEAGLFDPATRSVDAGFSRPFSQEMGKRGWIGMTWPKAYGGQERSYLERYVVGEELLAAGAPIRAHLVADRQSGPVLLKYAAEHLKHRLLPEIARGNLSFCIGMSEPNSGSDLFAAQAQATRYEKGWRLNGQKLWTSLAHHADYMIGVFRTAPATKENRRAGLSQFLIDMRSPGLDLRPVLFPNGEHEFNEVFFNDVELPEDHLLGEEGAAWKQLTSELAYERSGPERFLETLSALTALLQVVGSNPDSRVAEGIGRLTAQLYTLRRMSISVAGTLQAGQEPVLEASLVKEVGTVWEQQLPSIVRDLAAPLDLEADEREALDMILDRTMAMAPKLTIQGGTIEILRGIIARGLGLR